MPDAPAGAAPDAGQLSAAEMIHALVRRHGLTYEPTPPDRFAADVSRLSDAEVVPDAVEDLLHALAVAGAVTSRERLALHVAYLREVRPE